MRRCLPLVVLAILLAAEPAAAATLHVAPGGSGSACSQAQPCASFDAAYRAASLGDVVQVAPGSYGRQSLSPRVLPGSNSLTPSGEEITFKGSGANVDGLALSTTRGAPVEHVTFEDMTFTDWVVTRAGEDVHFVGTKHRAQVHTNWVHFLSYQGIEVGPFVDDVGHGMEFHQIDGRGGDNVLVEGSYIHDVHPNNTAAHPDGVHIFGTFNDFTFRGNRLLHNDHINFRGHGTMQRLVVENNFFGPERDPIVQRYYTAQIQGNGAVIRYNTFAGALQPSGTDERSGQVWEGNIMTWSTCDVTGSDSTVRYNVWVGGRSCGTAGRSVGDARFVDAGAGDLHLGPDSLAIGAGNPAAYPSADIDGNGRPAGGAPDAGADEYAGGAPPAPDPAPTGLVAAYGFEEPSGASVTDGSGLGNGGVVSGATRTAAGRFGRAIMFDGVNDWITVPDSSSLDLNAAMTLEAWVKPTTLSEWRTVLLKEQTGHLVYALYGDTDTDRPAATIFTDRFRDARGPAKLPTGGWRHLAATYDGETLRLYVDGEPVAANAAAGSMPASAGPLRIGGNSVWDEWFAGLIDEVRVYGRALGEAEIERDMASPVVAASTSQDPSPLSGPPAPAVLPGRHASSAEDATSLATAGSRPHGRRPQPRITRARVSPRRLCSPPRRGCRRTTGRLRFHLSRPVRLRVVLSRAGRPVRSLTVRGSRGVNVVSVSARGLEPGRYRISVAPVDGSRPAAVAFFRVE